MNAPARARPTKPLSSTVVEELKRLIQSGTLKPGERINEATLATQMGTSRGPIREAIRVLTGMGLVTPVANRGVFVRQVSIAEMMEIYDMRALIFGYACERATEFMTASRLQALQGLITQMEGAAKAGKGAQYYEINLRFHRTVLEFSNNKRAAEAYEGCVKELHLFRRPAFAYAAKMARSNQEHRAIVEAMAAGKGAEARKIGEKHVLQGRARLLESLHD
ncbi:MAG TPA: FCD domain-containing protein [Usitatibacter sp.]|nr:FCD domain-containing protein [Usitatibacter sp.]